MSRSQVSKRESDDRSDPRVGDPGTATDEVPEPDKDALLDIDSAADDEPQADLVESGEESASDLTTQVSRGVFWNLSTGFIVEVLTLAQFLILPMFLSPDEYGVYGIAAGIAFIGFMLRDFSLGMKFVQDKERTRQEAFDVAFTLELMLGMAGMLLMAAIAPLVGWLYGDPTITWVILAMAPFAFAGLLGLPEYILIKDMRFLTRMIRQTSTHVVTFGVTVWAAVAGLGVWALVISLPVNMFMMLVTLWPIVRVRPHLSWDKQAWRQYMQFGWPLWAGSLSLVAFYTGVINLLGAIFGLAMAGYFQRAWRVIEFSYRLNLRVTHVIYPAVVRIGRDIARLARAHKVVNRVTMTVCVPIAFTLLFLTPALIKIWPSDWWDAAPMLQAVGTFFVFGTLAFDWDAYYRAEGDTKPMFIIWVFLLAFLPVIVLVVWLFGEPGLYAAIVGLSFYVYLVRSYYVHKLLGRVSALRATWRQIAFGLIAGLAGLAVSTALGGTLEAGLIGALVLAVVFFAAMALVERRLLLFFLNSVRGKSTGGLSALIDPPKRGADTSDAESESTADADVAPSAA